MPRKATGMFVVAFCLLSLALLRLPITSYTQTLELTPTYLDYLPIIHNKWPPLPTPTMTPEPHVEVLSSNWIDVTGSGTYLTLWVVGELVNNASAPVSNVLIGGYTPAGIVATTYADIDTIAPGMKSPFLIRFQIENTGFVACDGLYWYGPDVSHIDWPDRNPYELQVTSQNAYYTDSGGTYNVDGIAINQTGETRTFVKAFVTVYNSSGEAIGRGWSYITPDALDPGQGATFHVAIYEWKDCPGGDHEIVGYQLLVLED